MRIEREQSTSLSECTRLWSSSVLRAGLHGCHLAATGGSSQRMLPRSIRQRTVIASLCCCCCHCITACGEREREEQCSASAIPSAADHRSRGERGSDRRRRAARGRGEEQREGKRAKNGREIIDPVADAKPLQPIAARLEQTCKRGANANTCATLFLMRCGARSLCRDAWPHWVISSLVRHAVAADECGAACRGACCPHSLTFHLCSLSSAVSLSLSLSPSTLRMGSHQSGA